MSLYLDCISQIKQRPKNDDIIWIYFFQRLSIWKKQNSKAKFVKEFRFTSEEEGIEIMHKEKSVYGNEVNPDIFIYKYYDAPDLTIIKTLFKKCKFFEVSHTFNFSETALIKARIMAKDEEVLNYDIETQLGENIFVEINEKVIMSIEQYESLPFEKTMKIKKGENVFKIFVVGDCKEEFQVTPPIGRSEQYEIFVKIDSNKIITIHYVRNSLLTVETTRNEAIENGEKKYYGEISKSSVLLDKNFNRFMLSYILPKKTFSSGNINAVGIDLGTSRCFAAVNRRNGIETIPLDNTGERHLPSYVLFSKGDDNLCGQIVVSKLQQNAKFIVFDSKRIIGKIFNEIKIDLNWPFKVIDNEGRAIVKIQNLNGYILKSPEEIAAILLKHIKQKAEEIQGKEINKVVITVPAAFNDAQKAATHNAGKLAGWDIIDLLPEPIAAAFAYFVDRPIPKDFNLLLFDFGGGTLDVCIMNVNNENLNIINMDGHSNLGGRDFDSILFNHFSQILNDQYKIDFKAKERSKYLLLQKCMEIKHILSNRKEDGLDIGYFNPNSDGTISIATHEFEVMSTELLDKIRETLISTLSTINYTSKDIHKVLLVGGSSRMPMVQQLLRKMFTNAEHLCTENPDEIVAIGAAYYAEYLNSTITN